MAYILKYIRFFIIPLSTYGIQYGLNPTEPKCFYPGNYVKRCCAGYRTFGSKCVVCVGSFGFQCVSLCPVGYYGIQCLEKCQCRDCDRITGECSTVVTTDSTMTTDKKKPLLNENTKGPSLFIWNPLEKSTSSNHSRIHTSINTTDRNTGVPSINITGKYTSTVSSVGSNVDYTTYGSMFDINIRTGVCKQSDGTYRCCSNYRKEGQNCVPCVGSFGVNCSGRCIDGFFGFGCLSECNCSENQICDHIVGCRKDKPKDDTESTRIYIISLSCGFVIFLLVLLVVHVVVIKRKMIWSQHYQLELVNTETTPVEYSSTSFQHQGYSEYDPRQMLRTIYSDNRFREIQSNISRGEQYESINPNSE